MKRSNGKINIPALTLAYMTRLPIHVKEAPEPRDFARMVAWFPLSSLVVGMISAFAFWCLVVLQLPLAAAVAAPFVELLLTGALHLDGLADTADAFFSGKSREEMLNILKDSRQGTFGVAAIVLDLLLRSAFLYGILENTGELFAILAVLLCPMAGKIPLAMTARLGNYPREKGGGQYVVEGVTLPQTLCCICITAVVLSLLFSWTGALAVGVLLVAGYALYRWAKRKIGGVTGDVMGAANELGEILFLFLIGACFRWLLFI